MTINLFSVEQPTSPLDRRMLRRYNSSVAYAWTQTQVAIDATKSRLLSSRVLADYPLADH